MLQTGQATDSVGTAARATGRTRAISAALAGNMFEWYDFLVYTYLAATIGKHFFAAQSDATSLLYSFAAFGVGFVARPIGGIVIGMLADKKGRRFSLILSVVLITVGSALPGVIPTYAQIGIAAPALIVLSRLIQGFSVGGEWGSSASLIVEWAPEGRRGFFGSLQSCSTTVGILLGSAVVALLTTMLSQTAMDDWGWRIPFWLAGVFGLTGLWMRAGMEDAPIYEHAKRHEQQAEGANDKRVLARRVLSATGIIIMYTVGTYIFLSYMTTFCTRYAGLTMKQALWANTIGGILSALVIPVFGHLSDKVGRKPLLLTCSVLFVLTSYPLYTLLASKPSVVVVTAVILYFDLVLALLAAAAPSALVEIFPTKIRGRWLTAVYAIVIAIFGGFAPFIATSLIAVTGNPVAPVFYVIFAALVSGFVIVKSPETAFAKLK